MGKVNVIDKSMTYKGIESMTQICVRQVSHLQYFFDL
jgi:hypothetical protein